MKPLMAGLLAGAALVLSGCYTSEKLLMDPAQAATPLAVGRQTTSGGEDKPETVQISLGADHWYVIHEDSDAKDKDQRVLFTPLAGAAPGEQRYVFTSSENASFLYGVATRRQGRIYFDLPSCDQPAAQAAAAAHGVTAPPGKALSPVCTFKDAASLTGALKDYADHTDPKRSLSSLPAAAS